MNNFEKLFSELLNRERKVKLQLDNYIDASDLHIAITGYNNGGSLYKVKKEFYKLKEKYPNKEFIPIISSNNLFVEIRSEKNR